MSKIKMRKDRRNDWDKVCGMCKNLDASMTFNHCCQVDPDTPLRYSGQCRDFEYEPDHEYAESYGYEVFTESEIERMIERL